MIKIQYKRSDKAKRLGLKLSKAHDADAGYDVPVCLEDPLTSMAIMPNEIRDIKSGIIVFIPEGYWAEIKARGSSFFERILHIHDAVHDSGYTGEVAVAIKNMSNKPFIVKDGDRLAQLILHNVVDADFDEIDGDFPDSDRGSNCMGSSGS